MTPGPVDDQLSGLAELLRDFTDALTRTQPMPGGVIVVTDRDSVLLELPFGLADVAAGTPVGPGHLFEIGSISKLFTSLLVNQLVDEGVMTLDDPITRWLPWVDAGPGTAELTLVRLLNHTSGLVTNADALTDEAAQVWSMRDRVLAEPGIRFHYSNVGYLMLGLAVAAATGQSSPDLLAHKVFEPMGMATAQTTVRSTDREQLATGYAPTYDDRPWVPGDPVAPATWLDVAAADGNVAVNGADLGRLLRLLLGDGSLDGRAVVSEQALARTRTLLAPAGEDVIDATGGTPVSDSRYGLGINVEQVGGHECVTHGGGMVGYASFVLADRTDGLGVGVITNANGDCLAVQVLARFVHRAVLAARAGAGLPTAPQADREVPADTPWPRLSGTSLDGRRVDVELGEVDGRLVVRNGGQTGRLWHGWEGRWSTDHPDLRLQHLDDTASPEPAVSTATELLAATGHYRSYSPWFVHLRIVARGDRLFLTAPGGVEAPGEDQELVPVAPGQWRIGADPWLPERLVAGPLVSGQLISVERDGCVYSRTFTP
jgi:CubicO group peptidase (beta-lactamase class C family)